MLFSEILDAMTQDADDWAATIPANWLQGRSAFGGLQAALAVRAMRRLVPAEMPLRTLQVTFMAPVPAGEVRIRAEVLRQGKSAIHVQARLFNGSEVLCLIVGVFGAVRVSSLTITPQQPPVLVQKPVDFPYIPGITPEFSRHFSMRWLYGGLPFTGSQIPAAILEIGMRDSGKVDETHVLAIADVIPPVGLSLLKKPVPGSSLTWMIEFLRDRFDDLPLQGWRMDAELTAAHDGYTNQTGMLWGPGGEAIALSRQSMVVFG